MKAISFGVISLLVLINGCIFPSIWWNPGYEIRIMTFETNSEIEELKRLILSLRFRTVSSQFIHPNHFTIIYAKEVPEAGKRIDLILKHNVGDTEKQKVQVSLLIGNIWAGKESILKAHIDQLGDFFANEIIQKVGKENVTIDRFTTGPPF